MPQAVHRRGRVVSVITLAVALGFGACGGSGGDNNARGKPDRPATTSLATSSTTTSSTTTVTAESTTAAPSPTTASTAPVPTTTTTAQPRRKVLVFSRTTGFRHESITAATAAVRDLGRMEGFDVDATEDPATFTERRLIAYDAVMFLLTTGDVLDEVQQTALERFTRGGGGFAGVHSAADTEYDWPFYGQLVGAYFARHPAPQTATVVIEDASHASTKPLPSPWRWAEEWYDFRANPRSKVHVLLRVDEGSYAEGGMGADHPISWCHRIDRGRSWYTGLGHGTESYADPTFRRHLAGGIAYAMGRSPACG